MADSDSESTTGDRDGGDAGCWSAPVSGAMALPLLLVVAAALVDVDGRVLIARRPAGKSMAGLWEFPGGKVRDGESPEQALVRELGEELGIDTRESCLAPLTFASHRYADFQLLMPLYVCRVWKGRPAAREGQEVAWVRPARLADYPMPPADLPVVALLNAPACPSPRRVFHSCQARRRGALAPSPASMGAVDRPRGPTR